MCAIRVYSCWAPSPQDIYMISICGNLRRRFVASSRQAASVCIIYYMSPFASPNLRLVSTFLFEVTRILCMRKAGWGTGVLGPNHAKDSVATSAVENIPYGIPDLSLLDDEPYAPLFGELARSSTRMPD